MHKKIGVRDISNLRFCHMTSDKVMMTFKVKVKGSPFFDWNLLGISSTFWLFQ